MSRLLSNVLHAQCPTQQAFVLASGQHVLSLQELADALHKMDATQFVLHSQRQDISRWVEDVFKQSSLATVLRTSSNPVTMARIIETVSNNGGTL